MVEYHGWVTICESVDGENEANINSIIKEVNKCILEISSDSQIMTLKMINGIHMLHFAGFSNHKNEDLKEVISLMNLISTIAKGSYGLMYLRDDEDINHNNEFVIHKIVKGNITIEKDDLLSPCNPTIEE